MKTVLISVAVALGVAALLDASQYTANPVAGIALKEAFDFYLYAAILIPIALVIGWIWSRNK